jgi:hypothetical protein
MPFMGGTGGPNPKKSKKIKAYRVGPRPTKPSIHLPQNGVQIGQVAVPD